MHTFDTQRDDVLLNALTVTAQRQGDTGSSGTSSGEWLVNESGQRINRNGSLYRDPNSFFTTSLFIQPKSEGSEWVDWADNILAIFSPFKALQGLTLMGKINPFSKPIAAKVLAEKIAVKFTTAIRFGNDPNQIHHVFRHTDELGLNRMAVQSAVQTHVSRLVSQIVPGQPFNRVIEIAGQRVQYTAFKLPDGTINVGRIHGTP
ncbi:hypothetical protein [Spirosoma areae]